MYSPLDASGRQERDDTRTLDLGTDQEPPFLRGQKRVSVRKGPLPRKTLKRLGWAAALGAALLACVLGAGALYKYGEHSWRFRVDSSDDLEISGIHNVTRGQVLEVMGSDIGRNIFFVPLSERKAQLEQIPWVESASVMRFVPNRLKIDIQERTPVAFARLGSKVVLVDRKGTLMELPSAQRKKFSFPVIVGMNPGEPVSTRSSRMRIYNDLVGQLDSGGAHYSQDLSEVDLSDPEDVKVVADDPAGSVLIHLGSSDYLSRYKVYVGHIRGWRQQFDKVQSVDLRYDHQIIVNPNLHGASSAATTSSVGKAAPSAALKPATLKVSAKQEKNAAAKNKKAAKVASHHKEVVIQDTTTHPQPQVQAKAPSSNSSKKPSASIAKQQETP